ncbi:hypothetical protein C7N43_09680 [Sphingobacteriales bacterium UPWRP_1]|nr:hypothetical protein C7N43_09680 [Sphingobacteriales bacterium UPWRP_1]
MVTRLNHSTKCFKKTALFALVCIFLHYLTHNFCLCPATPAFCKLSCVLLQHINYVNACKHHFTRFFANCLQR